MRERFAGVSVRSGIFRRSNSADFYFFPVSGYNVFVMFRIFFAILLFFLAFPVLAMAQGGLISCSGPACTLCDVLKTGSNIINFLTQVAIPIAVLFIVYGGFTIMTAGPSEERAGQGRKILTSAVIGVAIVLGSWLILNTVFLILNAQRPILWNKIQCAASAPNFGNFESAPGGASGAGVVVQAEGEGGGLITYEEVDGEYQVEGGLTEIYSDSKSYTWDDDGNLTITFERGTIVTENGMVTVEGGEIFIPAKDADKVDFEENGDGFGGPRITVNEGDLNISGNAVMSYEREISLDNGGMGSGREGNSATPRVPSQKTVENIGKYEQAIQAAAQKYPDISPSELKAMIAQESGGNPNAQSNAGAYGISQLKPETASQMAKGTQYEGENITGEWLKAHPEASIEFQAKYFSQQKRYGGDATAGYAGYNGGKAALLPSKNCPGSSRYQCGYDNDAHTVPNKGYEETRNYVTRVAGYESYFRSSEKKS